MKLNLKFWKDKSCGLERAIFIALSALTLLAAVLLSKDAGMSGDEHYHLGHAQDVVNFYTSFGKDSTAVHPNPKNGQNNLHMYGQLPDNIAYLIYNSFGINDIMQVRHAVASVFGWLAIFFAALLAFRITGRWRAAIFTLCLFFLSPRFFGQSFNNLKDPPFAAMLMMGTYYLLYFFQTFPKPPKRVIAMLALSIGLALAVRVGGLLLIAYFGLFGLIYWVPQWWQSRKSPSKKKTVMQLFKRLFLYGLAISAAGFFVGMLLWPYALVNPKHVFEIFADMSKWGYVLRHLFEGKMIWSDSNPWYYLPRYIAYTVPVVALMGAAIYPFVGGLKKSNIFNTFIVYFAFIFPVFWIIYTGANVYGGWRHAMFMYPPMVVAAGLGVDAIIEKAKSKHFKIAFTLLFFVLLINPFMYVVKNHPYEYLYFNQLAGGIKGAYGNYEMDYYYHSTREASEWILADVRKNGAPDSTRKTKVTSWHPASVNYFFRKDTADFSVGFVRWNERGNSDWDYAIFTITGMNAELLKNKKAFPPKNTAYQIKVDGVPICIVLKREEKSDFLGHRAMQQGNIGEAIPLLKKALDYDAYNEQSLNDLIAIYQHLGALDSAQMLAQRWVAFNRGNTTALNQLANIYLKKGDYSSAAVTANAIAKYNSRDISGLWVIAQAQAQQGQLNDALRTLQQLLRTRGDFKPAYQLMAQIYDRSGNRQRAQEIMTAVNSMP
ncbi:MAG: phospholipid carrier-dependent glycosyltransferase [Prevotellaceae bacterium]|nr:phospholipid carrier-dependent glycosyltransferase [Prevotellaceae bacterium]